MHNSLIHIQMSKCNNYVAKLTCNIVCCRVVDNVIKAQLTCKCQKQLHIIILEVSIYKLSHTRNLSSVHLAISNYQSSKLEHVLVYFVLIAQHTE